MNGQLYSTLPNTIIGFHGCDISTFNEVIMNQTELNASTNKYDWLGSGIYFWEHNLKRAYQWAEDASKRKNSKIKIPAVIGAVIDLGLFEKSLKKASQSYVSKRIALRCLILLF